AALSPVINELITETRRSLEYYASRYPGANIDRVLLMGGTARLRGLADVLSAELGLPVAVANPFDSVRLSPKSDLTPEYLAEMSPALCTGLGLAIRDMVED
ncbi:MAG: pilus assembly protein PilM, partial [Armatimonadetes bacterium CG17_big_fil_post_rev_8_21_14_2_50_66_6]